MKRTMLISLLFLMFAVLFSACETENQPVSGLQVDDETAVSELATAEDDDYLYDLSIDDGNEDDIVNGTGIFSNTYGFGKTTARVDSLLRFGRVIQRRGIRRLVITRLAPDTIKVGIVREFAGNFVVVEKGEDTTGTRPLIIHRKPLRHAVKRIAVYSRQRATDVNSDRLHRGWALSAVSLGAGHSVPQATIRILQVNIQTSGGSHYEFANPLDTLIDRESIPVFSTGEEVHVRVALVNHTVNPVDPHGNGATETVLLHFATNRSDHHRKHLRYVGEDPASGAHIYEGSWRVGPRPQRIHHAVFDAIDNGAIYETNAATYPYNSTTWSAPYRISAD